MYVYIGVYCYIGAVTCQASDVICCGLYFKRAYLLFTLFSTHMHLNYHRGRWNDVEGGAATQWWGRDAAQGNNLRKYVFRILKSRLQANFGTHNSVKICGKIFPNIRNNLRKKRFENFEEICMNSEILRKLTYVRKF